MTQQEFKYCFDQWFEEVRNYICFRCKDPDLATDIVQSTFVKIWEKQLEFQGDATRSLVYKIAKETWISEYRKQNKQQEYQLHLKSENPNSTEEAMDLKELKKVYELALGKLSEKRRAVYLMSRQEEMSYKEIAACLNLSVKAVEKRMNGALQELRKALHHVVQSS
ncbi:RNA polymerase sigma factor [Luteibaculum oceani]|uniref:RNA polymerase sigma factor n=1 Tax=Luteibaculum oceani TaxID=1294296 RepID=UPI00147710FF|nr:sigma-70 family RNA polymerase sigma factor [Luteibaculum oceani]